MTVEFIASVFIVHIIEACIAWQYFNSVFMAQYKPKKMLLAFFLAYLMAFSFSLFDSIPVNTTVFTAVNFALAMISFHAGIKEALFHTLALTATMNVTEWIVLVVLGIIFGDISAYRTRLYILIILIIMSKSLFLLCMEIFARILGKKKTVNYGKTSGVLLLSSVPAATVVMGTTMMYIGISTELNSSAQAFVIVSTLLLIAANLTVFVAYHKNQELNERYYESQLLLQKESADSAYYKMLEEQYEGQRILIHDIRKHLQTVKDMANMENAVEVVNYVNELEKFPSLQRRVRICNNTTLNLILVRYSDKFKAEGIDFHVDIRDKSIDFVSASDLSTIFANLLDNAYEAAVQAQDAYVELMVERVNNRPDITMISMVNSAVKPPEKNGFGEYLTSKDDKKRHGLGMKSIKSVIKKYEGILKMTYVPGDSTFHITITLNNKITLR